MTNPAVEATGRALLAAYEQDQQRVLAARCPLALRIYRAHSPISVSGMASLAARLDDPGTWKRQAAAAILTLRLNSSVLRDQARPLAAIRRAAVHWLDRAARCRREAVRLTNPARIP